MADPQNITELDLVVGSMITTRQDEDREVFEEERDTIALVQDRLREEGLDVDLLAQPGTEVWEGGIETLGSLYQLLRMVRRLETSADILQVIEDGPVIYEDTLDPVVTDVWDGLAETRFPHLVNLQGIHSYFLPLDFDRPLKLPFEDEEGEEDEAYFASSIRLQSELVEIADMLHTANISEAAAAYRSEAAAAYRCLQVLRTAADQSTRFGLPIIVW
jgi:hypothetical protein